MKTLCYFIFFVFTASYAQKQTLTWQEGMKSPDAKLENYSWIAGHWQGEAFGGIAEEVWTPPLGGSMMFVFKLVNDWKVSFYEIGYIKQIEETLILQLKHFHGDLKGWEAKDETVDFKLIKAEGKKLYFDGFTIEKVSDDQLKMYVAVGSEDGTTNEVEFNYRRVR
ncbi:DUF6265 family protein [Sungkyunkwania multivorans]|uniref:DUF6265 family protein n=1 Tax=Sungkyunkwania multivorans TaxID=1173618 RepID=A0ABW3D223_9FLAO